jgi:hypothetical protein
MNINLFSYGNSFQEKEKRELDAKQKVDNIPVETFLSTPETNIISFAMDNCLPEIPEILQNEIYANEPYECSIEQDIYGLKETITVKGTAIKIHIPFKGEDFFFRIRPSTYETFINKADEISSNEIVRTFHYSGNALDKDIVTREINDYTSFLTKHLECLRRDFSGFKDHLRRMLEPIVAERKVRLLAQKKLANSLPFPIKRRE